MTRPARQIDDHAAILDDPAAHRPDRPWWTCTAGDGDWPCAAIRGHLAATMPAVDISMVMAGYYRDAVSELQLQPAEVHRRMFGWVGGPAPAEPGRPPYHGWHPPGGPF